MKTFKKQAAQGDVFFEKIDQLPDGLEKAKPKNGNIVVAHSETGHSHVIDSRAADLLIDQTNQFIAYLDIKKDCTIEHLRNHDKHESIAFKKGDRVRVRRQREYIPEGFRKAQD